MTAQFQDVRTDFDWQPQPAAAAFVARLLSPCIRSNPQIADLERRMRDETGTRLVDWVDSFTVGDALVSEAELTEAGYAPDPREPNVWRHSEGLFPAIRRVHAMHHDGDHPSNDARHAPSALAIKVGSVDDFATAFGASLQPTITGQPGSQFRVAAYKSDQGTQLRAIERHGWPGFGTPANRAQQIAAAAKHARGFAERRRDGAPDAELFAHAADLCHAAAADLGRDWACDLFFAAERDYWMSRNAAARVQFERQQKLGLGWGNHDHHTYRSSRESFVLLIRFLELMGFACRERFYAGREAGWGAQVIEQPNASIVIFADVDLTPDEVMGDFAHEPLAPQPKLGTVGLWCMLHGEAFLSAGMHHLECQFDFDAVREQLAAVGVESMTPFTDWPHLKQAFTKGEMFAVSSERINAAQQGGYITADQAAQFAREGALGSHMEILERNDGFKGFNQTGISEIITRTDPRRATVLA